MKALLAIFGLILGLLIMENSWGAEPAYQRECRIAGGIYWAVSVNSMFDTPLCRIGRSVVGAAEFAEFKWERKPSQSIGAYAVALPTANPDTVCAPLGARFVTASDSNHDFWRLCIFADNSIIGTETLSWGPKSEYNQEFNTALGL